MSAIAFVLSLIVIAIAAVYLYRKLNPQGVLLLAGLAMLILALLLHIQPVVPAKPTGSVVFDLIKVVEETFITNFSRAGMMIMVIGGYVAFMNHIEATNALVHISMKPLGFFRRYPYLAATIAIPIGQMLFITTPSAAGLGLLLVASVYPVLINLGVSKLTALSVIAAATLFDQGPGSANTALAAELVGNTNVEYFIIHQLPLVIPTTLVVMTLFYLNNRYFDIKDKKRQKNVSTTQPELETLKYNVPLIFAILPVLPLILLIIFSPYVGLFDPPITLGTTGSMIFSLFVSLVFVICRMRSIRKTIDTLSSFWKGMGNVFASIITLIVASEIFSKGLISLGFIDLLVSYSTHMGLSGIAIAVVFALIIFSAAMLMGSGNAAFFSFGPLLPGVAGQLSLPVYSLVLPLQLAASMGRAASPIAGIIVAIALVAGVSPIELAKRNTLPLIGSIIFLIVYYFFIS
ncbi:C4-dicarboxylate transporter DcuC [uncultured Bacteroides sp.]|uniref:C4-dicarboxylate transporter DcuC n=1 Tax=uncultured Bacteroides sp. TaxID=162156 RepID=UPI002AA6C207|nr:C4-dicarboxylate transporter DcuC [uncultured Bacteroides sp.]